MISQTKYKKDKPEKYDNKNGIFPKEEDELVEMLDLSNKDKKNKDTE